MNSVSNKAALGLIMVQAFAGNLFPLVDKTSKELVIKNKYNLNDEQKEFIKTLSAKEKKKYFKDLK